MAFIDKTRCRAVVTGVRALAPWANPRHGKWGKQDVVILDFLPGRHAVLMPIHSAWMIGEATAPGEVVGDRFPRNLGVTTSDGVQVVAGTALSALMDRYRDVAMDTREPQELRSAAVERFRALVSIG